MKKNKRKPRRSRETRKPKKAARRVTKRGAKRAKRAKLLAYAKESKESKAILDTISSQFRAPTREDWSTPRQTILRVETKLNLATYYHAGRPIDVGIAAAYIAAGF